VAEVAVESTNDSSRFENLQFAVGEPLSSPPPSGLRSLVARAFGPPDPRRPDAPKFAALVVHGVGQQTKFETLDMLAEGIARAAGGAVDGPPVARLVTVGDERLHRIELTLRTDGGTRALHVYEAYWAPLTEGAVTLRDVIHLVFRTIYDGIRNGTSEFRRWLFGQYRPFPPQVRTVAVLLVGLAALLSLILINTVIGLAVSTRWVGGGETVIGDGLYGDLSTAFNVLFVCVFAFVIALGLHRWAGRAGAPVFVRAIAGGLSVLLFALTVAVTIAVGLAIPLLFYLHRVAGPGHKLPLFPSAFGLAIVDWFNDRVEVFMPVLVVALLGAAALRFVVHVTRALGRAFRDGETRKALTIAIFVFAAVTALGLVVEVVWLALTDWGIGVSGSSALERGSVWALLIAGSLIIRRILVEYVGDIVAYVHSHTVDRFDELRTKIRERVYKTARAVYACRDNWGNPEYSDIVLIGHSLGSVIAYDTLNRLINEDVSGAGGVLTLGVIDRTPLFLTVGSPLDKTAYLFGAQRKQRGGTYALAATVQPLIQRAAYRPARWVNIHSRWDPISGEIDFYGLEPEGDREGDRLTVRNLVDPDATTLFLAHLEYWQGTLIYRTLLDALPWGVTHAQRASAETSCPHPGLPVAEGSTGLERI